MKQPIGIQLPQLSHEAVLNGASKFILPIEQEITMPIDSKYPEKEMYLDAYNYTNKWYWWTQDGRQNLNQCIESPLQIGDEFYLQEEFWFDDEWDETKYKTTDSGEKLIYTSSRQNWQPASQMTYEQSRYKFKVKSIEVKRVQNITREERMQLISDREFISEVPTVSRFMLEKWHNKQYPNQSYNSNPYGFLVEIEKE